MFACLPSFYHQDIKVDMSDQPPGKQSKKSRLLRPFKGLFSRLHSRSPSPSRPSETPHNATASISVNSVTSAPQASYQSVIPHNENASISASPTISATSASQASYRAQSVTPHNEKTSISASPTIGATSASKASYQGSQSIISHSATASISASPTKATSAPQVIPQGTEYTAILDLSTSPSTPLTWEHRMKECGSTAYEGLKTAIQGIYDCSGIFPPLQATAGVLLTISKVVDVRVSLCSRCRYPNNGLFYPSEGFSE